MTTALTWGGGERLACQGLIRSPIHARIPLADAASALAISCGRGGGQARRRLRRLIAIVLSCLENEPKPL
ncbi:hypothetical protein SK854_08215 [Lentzea sp. BCCO 10_0061]|uniref:Uncharacterized protein n=1 Tax=Lentzea sokolovensis TaxID=3095429 RepID=A0ABU4URG2_9PSEU|nr:hypothetical protein [Lentzea sp. BCCO 10_0061]MDX8142091.1 hypothetical protein [Lentzea sp. BCCO 10_0061]